MRDGTLLISSAALAVAAAGCSSSVSEPLPEPPAGIAAITVTAPQLTNGQLIKPRYTCDSVNISPEIAWSTLPNGTVTTIVIVDDPDAPGGSFTHWLIYDIPPDATGVTEGAGSPFDTLRPGGLQGVSDAGGIQGATDFGDLGYSGPCPPSGQLHSYALHVYALDRELGLAARAERDEVLVAMEGAIIGHGVLRARYQSKERTDVNVVFKTPTPEGT